MRTQLTHSNLEMWLRPECCGERHKQAGALEVCPGRQVLNGPVLKGLVTPSVTGHALTRAWHCRALPGGQFSGVCTDCPFPHLQGGHTALALHAVQGGCKFTKSHVSRCSVTHEALHVRKWRLSPVWLALALKGFSL